MPGIAIRLGSKPHAQSKRRPALLHGCLHSQTVRAACSDLGHLHHLPSISLKSIRHRHYTAIEVAVKRACEQHHKGDPGFLTMVCLYHSVPGEPRRAGQTQSTLGSPAARETPRVLAGIDSSPSQGALADILPQPRRNSARAGTKRTVADRADRIAPLRLPMFIHHIWYPRACLWDKAVASDGMSSRILNVLGNISATDCLHSPILGIRNYFHKNKALNFDTPPFTWYRSSDPPPTKER